MNEDKASRYHRLKRRAIVGYLLTQAAVYAGLLATGWSVRLRDAAVAASGSGPSDPEAIALYVAMLSALVAVVSLPLVWYDSFRLEHRFGMSAESAGEFFRDHLKATGLNAALAVLAAEVVFAAMRTAPRSWWAVAAAALTLGMALIAGLAPILLFPLFYRFKQLDRRELHDRLAALSQRAGVRVLGVYEWGLGAKSRRANAALVGSWRTRRVLVSDTLLAEYTDDEIEVILAHELGHHAHRDLLSGLALEALLITAALGVGSLALGRAWLALGLTGPSDVAGLPLLLLAAGAVMVGATPLVNGISRHHERRADRYALALTDRPAALVSALRRLGAQNLAETNPDRIALWLFHSHPPLDERISAARAFAQPVRPRAPLPAAHS
ncbi:MAG: M48 family metalloprotease [Vicinamibacterales bacterium]